MVSKVENSVVKLLRIAHPKIKKAVKDPDMWPCVKHLLDDLVDELWPDIEQEVILQLKMKISKPVVVVPRLRNKSCCSQIKNFICCPYFYFRKWYLYSTKPCFFPFYHSPQLLLDDRSFWVQSKTISYWLFLLISAIPYYGVQSGFYILIFLMMDKRDEYQLCEFILNFKKMQFFTVGWLQAVVGYTMYFKCATLTDQDDIPERSTQ